MQHADAFARTRQFSLQLTSELTPEDAAIQSMPDVSPTRWHLAHTTWFFETFLLKDLAGYCVFDSAFEYLFNSYYNTVGEQYPRDRRGLISRPGLAATLNYRQYVDQHVQEALQRGQFSDEQLRILQLGIQHEQQHQELMLTDIKHVLSCNPLHPSYYQPACELPLSTGSQEELGWQEFREGVVEVGHATAEFAFDNELPRHKQYIHHFAMSTRCINNREFGEFIEDGGYQRPELWLSLGWQTVQAERWQAPLYWRKQDQQWFEFTLCGLRPLAPTLPVCHVSYFEADAFARWAGHRLPTEFEWELASQLGHGQWFADHISQQQQVIHPCSRQAPDGRLADMFGSCWEWTASQYLPYPGYQPPAGALGEYNGKFMCNQFVLRGGSCASSANHVRPTYRNFFPPEARWQFSGIRLARS